MPCCNMSHSICFYVCVCVCQRCWSSRCETACITPKASVLCCTQVQSTKTPAHTFIHKERLLTRASAHTLTCMCAHTQQGKETAAQ